MTTQYFRYSEPLFSDARPQVTIASPELDAPAADKLIERITFRVFVASAVFFGSAGLFLLAILAASPGLALLAFFGLIAGLILTIVANRAMKSNLRQFNVGYGKTALAIARAHGLLSAGSLLDAEARAVAKILWETDRSNQNVDSNRPLQDTLNAISNEAEARITEREQETITHALNESHGGSYGPGNSANTAQQAATFVPPQPENAPESAQNTAPQPRLF